MKKKGIITQTEFEEAKRKLLRYGILVDGHIALMKKNYGFEVSLNGKKLARAGIPKENYVVNCIVDAVHRKDGSEELYMRISGLDTDAQMYVGWFGE